MRASFHCCGTSPPPLQIQTTISSSPPSQGGITVEGDLEQLNGDSVRSDSLSVRQRADGACQLLHRGLDSKRHVLGPLFADEFNVRSGVRRPRLLTYAELWSRFPSRIIVFRCLKKPAWSLSRARVSSFSRTKSQKKAQHGRPCEPSQYFFLASNLHGLSKVLLLRANSPLLNAINNLARCNLRPPISMSCRHLLS